MCKNKTLKTVLLYLDNSFIYPLFYPVIPLSGGILLQSYTTRKKYRQTERKEGSGRKEGQNERRKEEKGRRKKNISNQHTNRPTRLLFYSSVIRNSHLNYGEE